MFNYLTSCSNSYKKVYSNLLYLVIREKHAESIFRQDQKVSLKKKKKETIAKVMYLPLKAPCDEE